MRVGLVIPAYEAAGSIASVVERSLAVSMGESVLVVDDGSTDETGERAREAGAHVLCHEHNQGKGAALQTGFEYWMDEGVDGVVTLDADGQHLPEEIHKLLVAAARGADLVLGVRSHLFAEMTALRRSSNKLSTGLISYAADHSVSDVQTGFRFYSRRLIEEIGLRESGFEAESAVFVRSARRGLEIVTTPIELGFADGVSTSHFKPMRDSVRIARAVIGAMREGSA